MCVMYDGIWNERRKLDISRALNQQLQLLASLSDSDSESIQSQTERVSLHFTVLLHYYEPLPYNFTHPITCILIYFLQTISAMYTYIGKYLDVYLSVLLLLHIPFLLLKLLNFSHFYVYPSVLTKYTHVVMQQSVEMENCMRDIL